MRASALASAAIVLATRLEAQLAVVETINFRMPFTPAWDMAPSGILAEAYDDLRERAQVHAARVRKRLQKESVQRIAGAKP